MKGYRVGQMVQTRATNHLGGYDYEFFHYNFTGQVLNKSHKHNTPFITSPLTENYKLRYDNANRLTALRYALNTQKEIVMDSLVYDELGRVSKKILHGGIQTINYKYNIQNELTSISSPDFTETLTYQDSPFGNGCYNGNISTSVFSKGNNSKLYSYTYDQMNRLTSATNGPSLDFSETVSDYDLNGNMKGIKRYGYVYDNSYNISQGPIDNLTMTYNGNQLESVSDAADQSKVITTNDFLDKQGTTEYIYDKNGNQTADLNKNIALIRYNILNCRRKCSSAMVQKTSTSTMLQE